LYEFKYITLTSGFKLNSKYSLFSISPEDRFPGSSWNYLGLEFESLKKKKQEECLL